MMQLEKSKKLLTSLMDVCDQTLDSFYLAASTGLVSNKMSCVQFAFKFIYETSRQFSILSSELGFVSSINATMQTFSPDVESVERTFGVMFNSLQQYRLHIKSWQDVLDHQS